MEIMSELRFSQLWDITLCSQTKADIFGGSCHLRLQYLRVSQTRHRLEAGSKHNEGPYVVSCVCCMLFVDLLLRLLFDHGDGVKMFFLNVG